MTNKERALRKLQKRAIKRIQAIETYESKLLAFEPSFEEPIDENSLNVLDPIDKIIIKKTFTTLFDSFRATNSEQIIRVLSMRFGLNDDNPKTLQETAKQMNYSVTHIRNIENKGLRMLRHPTRITKLEPFVEFA